jgi:gliding motility-associated-like protein
VITNSDPDIPSFILSIEGSAATPIIIPNLFSPNGDGVNDNFILHADREDVANIQLWVYDRYNNIVFESNNIEEITQIGWDGTRNGVALPTDTYFWKVSGTFTDGTKVEFDGQQQGKIRLIVE